MINESKKMPMLFVGHGSPMNAIEDNKFSREWAKIASRIPKPEAIISISAHWYTNGTLITDAPNPSMVYDMYGFPDELYQVQYNPSGSPELAHLTKDLISLNVHIDNTWGLDHGSWSVLRRMYPDADIPVFQLSVDRNASALEQFQIGQNISALREKGILIFASGNVVHNLYDVNFNMEGGYVWATEFDQYIKDNLLQKQYHNVIDYKNAGKTAELAVPTPDHFYPLLYILGAARPEDEISVFNESCNLGSLSMTSYLFE